MKLRSTLYSLARLLGWINAALRGKLVQRLARVLLLRTFGGWVNRIIR
jgi:hypothetical protein